MKEGYILIQAQIPKELHAKIIEIAENEDRSLANWIRYTLTQAVKKN